MILTIWRNTFTKREKRIKSQYVRIVSLFKIKDLRLGADVLEFLHSSEDLVRTASICCQSHVKIAIKYMISLKRRNKWAIVDINLDPSTSFRYKRKAKSRPWNTLNTLLKFDQIEGIFFRINYGMHGRRYWKQV